MSGYERTTDRGILVSGREWKAIGGAGALMALNVLVMYVFAATPLAVVNEYLFAYPIVGVLIYGAAIMGGELLAERGVEDGDAGAALAGVALLQVAFGTFGAGVLSFAPRSIRGTALAITALVVAAMTAGIGLYVYARSISFDHYATWANYAFIGGGVAVLVGPSVSPMRCSIETVRIRLQSATDPRGECTLPP